ncbi:MAG: DsbC family protein [Methylophilaceae bacterium]|nr:DsbC family protein [Methylophilaceae bacterium]
MALLNRLAAAVLSTLIPLAAWADSNTDAIRAQLEKVNPGIKISSVTLSPIANLYEVFANGQILYVDKSAQYVLAGARLVEVSGKRNLTEERLSELTTIQFDTLPLKDAITIKKGNGAYKFAVFSDPDCPYCKSLEQGLEKTGTTDYTAYIFLLPLKELHPDAAVKAESIWCAKDRNTAWNDWMIKGTAPEKASCENPLANNEQLAGKLGVSSTPTIYLQDGKQTQRPQAIIAAIKAKP